MSKNHILMEEAANINNEFWQCYGASWNKKYRLKTEIQNLLHNIDKQQKLMKIDSITQIGKNEIILMVSVHDADNSLNKIYINLTTGYPSMDHYLEATYGLGSDAHSRIIAYSRGNDYRNRTIVDLVRHNNECGLNTHLVEVKRLGLFIYYEMDENSIANISEDIREIPSMNQIREVEFWNEFYGSGDYGAEPKELDYIYFTHQRFLSYTLGERRNLEIEWNDKGFFIYFTDNEGFDLIHWLWGIRSKITSHYIETNHPNYTVLLLKDDEGRPMIGLRLIDVSLSDLLDAAYREKSSYGMDVFLLEFEVKSIFEDLINEYNNQRSHSIMRSAEETRDYLSDKNILTTLFDDIRDNLKSELNFYDLADGEYCYWCGWYCSELGQRNFFNNFKSFCRKVNLDWTATKEAIEKMTDEDFFCECQMVNRFEGNPANSVEEHWKRTKAQEHAS